MTQDDALKSLIKISQLDTLKTGNELVEYKTIGELKKLLKFEDEPKSLNDWSEVLKWVKNYIKYSPNTRHPHFVNRMWSGANATSIVGEMIVALTNTSGCTFESAPMASLMENYILDEMLNIVGFKHGEGQMTTGSSNANMIAMMIARNQAHQTTKKEGLFGQEPLYAFVNEDAHYSLDKAANILGIGTKNLIKISTLEDGSMNTQELEDKISSLQKKDAKVFFVCATLGTTVRGAYDNLTELLKLKEKYNFWLHGDGAWGGAAILSDTLRAKYLQDVDKIDSFTMDFHKMLGNNLMCNVFLINSQGLLSCTCADGDNSYIFRNNTLDLGVDSLQCGRRVDSLKLFLDWKFYTKKGFAQRVERYHSLAIYIEKYIRESKTLELVVPRSSFNVCFRFKTSENESNALNQKIRDELHTKHNVLLNLSTINSKLVFRLLISNTKVDKKEIDTLLEKIINIGQTLRNDI